MIDNISLELMKSFNGSFINQHGEFIAQEKGNVYFNLSNCKDDMEVKCKVLEWLSRDAHKGIFYRQHKRNEECRQFLTNGINQFLGTEFNKDDMEDIYCELGNQVNRQLTLKFIESNYNMNVLTSEVER